MLLHRVPVSAKDRFTALQSGQIDVLARNTTKTAAREMTLGLKFGAVNFFDGQAFMVRKALKVNSALELSGASVCVQQAPTKELNTAEFFRKNKMKVSTMTFASGDEAQSL